MQKWIYLFKYEKDGYESGPDFGSEYILTSGCAGGCKVDFAVIPPCVASADTF